MVKLYDECGREVVDTEIDGDHGDTYFARGYYADTGKEVDEDTLDYLNDNYPEVLAERALDRAIMAAEAAYEGDR
jgi:hypothetical protein